MPRLFALLLFSALALVPSGVAALEPARFRAVDVYVDSGNQPLAAYQVEIVARNATIAGVEGGEHQAFADPPHYDPAALRGGRIILAAFNTGNDLPTGRTRVATLHMEEIGPAEYEISLTAAAAAGGGRIDARASVVPRGDHT